MLALFFVLFGVEAAFMLPGVSVRDLGVVEMEFRRHPVVRLGLRGEKERCDGNEDNLPFSHRSMTS